MKGSVLAVKLTSRLFCTPVIFLFNYSPVKAPRSPPHCLGAPRTNLSSVTVGGTEKSEQGG